MCYHYTIRPSAVCSYQLYALKLLIQTKHKFKRRTTCLKVESCPGSLIGFTSFGEIGRASSPLKANEPWGFVCPLTALHWFPASDSSLRARSFSVGLSEVLDLQRTASDPSTALAVCRVQFCVIPFWLCQNLRFSLHSYCFTLFRGTAILVHCFLNKCRSTSFALS